MALDAQETQEHNTFIVTSTTDVTISHTCRKCVVDSLSHNVIKIICSFLNKC